MGDVVDDARADSAEPKREKHIQVEDRGWYESIILFLGIAVAAILGAYVRIGIGYYKIWRTETNYVSFFCFSFLFSWRFILLDAHDCSV